MAEEGRETATPQSHKSDAKQSNNSNHPPMCPAISEQTKLLL